MLLRIPEKLLQLHPDLTKNEIRIIIRTILNSKSAKLKSSHIVDFTMPLIGRFKTHGLKKVKRRKADQARDRKKKRIKYNKLLMTKEKLLW